MTKTLMNEIQKHLNKIKYIKYRGRSYDINLHLTGTRINIKSEPIHVLGQFESVEFLGYPTIELDVRGSAHPKLTRAELREEARRRKEKLKKIQKQPDYDDYDY